MPKTIHDSWLTTHSVEVQNNVICLYEEWTWIYGDIIHTGQEPFTTATCVACLEMIAHVLDAMLCYHFATYMYDPVSVKSIFHRQKKVKNM